MVGRRSSAFHEGDRSEYLATFILSSVAAVTPVPRQEDYGLDHICALTRREGTSLFVESGFGVQVKSEDEGAVIYGGMTEKNVWKRWEPNWLFHQDYPFFIATVEKAEWRLKLYSTARMWGAQWLSGGPYEISLHPNVDSFDAPPEDHRYSRKDSPGNAGEGNGVWGVALGPPVIDVSARQIEEKSFRTTMYECLSQWIEYDRQNLIHHKLGIPYTTEPREWRPNEPPGTAAIITNYFNPTQNMNVDRILRSIAPAIASLIHNFSAQSQTTRLEKVRPLVDLLDEYGDYLDSGTRGIIDGLP